MACEMDIAVAKHSVLLHYKNEPSEAYHSNLCRVATLYLHGSLYFDVDLDIVDVYILEVASLFVTSLGSNGG